MKRRLAFVSNSSSASFALAKVYMTDDQIRKFSDFITYLEDGEDHPNCEEYRSIINPDDVKRCEGMGSPFETKKYYFGEVDNSVTGPISEFLEHIGVNKEDYAFES